MSSSGKSNENLLSARGMDKSESLLNECIAIHSAKKFRTNANLGCVYGTDSNVTNTTNNDELEESGIQIEKQLVRNLIVLGIGHIFVFSAFTALQSLQSSLFLETGLGLQALCVLYSCAVLSSFYGPAFVQKFTPNWTIVLSVVLVALFASAFFYPRQFSLVPTAIALGLVFGPFYNAQITFLMHLVTRMSYLTAGVRLKVQQKYLRMFLFFSYSSRIWGHVIAALLIHYGGDIYVLFTGSPPHFLRGMNPRFAMSDMHPSPYATVAKPSLCTLEKMSDDNVFRNPTSYIFILPLNLSLMLISVFLGMIFLGVAVVTTLLDKCDLYTTKDGGSVPLLKNVVKVAVAIIDPQFRLFLPFVLFMGLEQGFILADFTRSYVSCALGMEAVSYTMIAMGATSTVVAVSVPHFSKHVQRPSMMAVGITCQAGLLMVLWLWVPVKDDKAVFYIIATGWGLCHAIWETLITTHITTTYADDWQEMFAIYYMTQWLGLAAAFGWSASFVKEVKICILAGVLTVSIICYMALELKSHFRRKEQERVVEL